MLDDNKDIEQEGQETPEEQPVEQPAEETAPAVEAKEEAPEEPVQEETPVAEEAAEETPAAETEEAEEEQVAAPAAEASAGEEAETEEEEVEASDDGEEEEEDEDEEIELPEEETVIAETAHDDFDWSVGNKSGLGSSYSEDEVEKYTEQYESTLTSVFENEIVKGKVTSIHDGDVVLDINFKSDGLVSLSEFRENPDLAVGDEVEVYVEQQEDARGQLVLSRRKAKLLRAWENIVDSYENRTVLKGTVISKTKGGLIVDCGGLETFLPGSQIDIKPIIDYDSYVGKTMEFRVVKINEQIKNAVVSHKALIESDLQEQREAIIASLEKGQVLEGLVKNITDFGAFLDLG
ncbi:MAG: S1 RNA-binding domain-containing protein, partial [Phaeodactylibacter sp.]|nr:S1 RNA-binding domain-containing protein [Phaeodactylibacter sp.]